MKFVGLVSGGKDSVYSICKLLDEGHELVGLINLRGSKEYSDSYMFQTVGEEIVKFLGECFGVPILIHSTECKTINMELAYRPTEGDEVEDMFECLKGALHEIEFEGVSSGAILSTYQKNRVEEVCSRLGIKSLSPLWNRVDQRVLLLEMIQSGIEARIVKIASPVFGKECVGMRLNEILKYMDEKMVNVEKHMQINYCGEGGEYETIVFDCKYFKKRIEVGHFEVVPHPEEVGKEGSVYFARFSDVNLIQK